MRAKQKTTIIRECLVVFVLVLSSLIIGAINNDIVIGGSLLMTGLVGSYLAGRGRKSNYIFGLINALLIAYVAYRNNLFGSFAINAFLFTPLEIAGFLAWDRNLNQKKNVKVRRLSTKNAVIVTSACLIGSAIFGYLLTLIPSQQMAFLDSTMCCLDICALVMMNLRYRESWWLWAISGGVSVVVWAIAFAGGGANTLMRLIAAIGFFFINIYGAIRWNLKTKHKKY